MQYGSHGLHQTVVLAAYAQAEGIFRCSHEEFSIAGTGAGVRRIGCLQQFAQAVVQHGHRHVEHVLAYVIGHCILLVIGHYIVLEEELSRRALHFFVLTDVNQRFFVVFYRIVDTFGSIYRCLYVSKDFFQLGFDVVHVDVTHDDDTLQVGAVPFFIVVADVLIREVVDDVDTTDRHTVGILGIWIQRGKRIGHDAEHTAVAASPFFANHTAFLVDFLVGQFDSARPVVQDQQTRVYDVDVVGGHVADVVYSLVYCCIGVQVGTELDTFGFTPRYDAQTCFIPGEVLCTVESHVLQEVSQSALLRFFQDGTNFLCDVEFYSLLGTSIVANVVSQSVVQLTDAHIFVHWQGLYRLLLLSLYGLVIAAKKHRCHQ